MADRFDDLAPLDFGGGLVSSEDERLASVERAPRRTLTPTRRGFDPDGDGYDDSTAKSLIEEAPLTIPKPTSYQGDYVTDPRGAFQAWVWHDDVKDYRRHSGSRDHRTGQMLKGRGHKTFDLALKGEAEEGNVVYKAKDGRYYSHKPENVPEDAEIIDSPAKSSDLPPLDFGRGPVNTEDERISTSIGAEPPPKERSLGLPEPPSAREGKMSFRPQSKLDPTREELDTKKAAEAKSRADLDQRLTAIDNTSLSSLKQAGDDVRSIRSDILAFQTGQGFRDYLGEYAGASPEQKARMQSPDELNQAQDKELQDAKGEFELQYAKYMTERYQAYMETAQKPNIKEALKRVERKVAKGYYVPFSPTPLAEMVKLNMVGKKIVNGEELSELESAQLMEFVAKRQLQQTVGEKIPGRILEGVMEMLPYAGEMMLTSGLASGLRASMSKGISAKIGESLGAQAISRLTQGIAVAGMRTALTPAKFGAGMLERMLPEYEMSKEDDKWVVDWVSPGQDKGTAFYNTLVDRMTELLSEESGSLIKALPRNTRRAMVKMGLLKAMKASNPNMKLSQLRQTMSAAGIGGFTEEMFEEQYKRILDAAGGVDMQGEGMQERVRAIFPQSMDDVLVEAGTLAFPTAAGAVSQIPVNVRRGKRLDYLKGVKKKRAIIRQHLTAQERVTDLSAKRDAETITVDEAIELAEYETGGPLSISDRYMDPTIAKAKERAMAEAGTTLIDTDIAAVESGLPAPAVVEQEAPSESEAQDAISEPSEADDTLAPPSAPQEVTEVVTEEEGGEAGPVRAELTPLPEMDMESDVEVEAQAQEAAEQVEATDATIEQAEQRAHDLDLEAESLIQQSEDAATPEEAEQLQGQAEVLSDQAEYFDVLAETVRARQADAPVIQPTQEIDDAREPRTDLVGDEGRSDVRAEADRVEDVSGPSLEEQTETVRAQLDAETPADVTVRTLQSGAISIEMPDKTQIPVRISDEAIPQENPAAFRDSVKSQLTKQEQFKWFALDDAGKDAMASEMGFRRVAVYFPDADVIAFSRQGAADPTVISEELTHAVQNRLTPAEQKIMGDVEQAESDIAAGDYDVDTERGALLKGIADRAQLSAKERGELQQQELEFAARRIVPLETDRQYIDPPVAENASSEAKALHDTRQFYKELLWKANAWNDDTLSEIQDDDYVTGAAEAEYIKEALEGQGEWVEPEEKYADILEQHDNDTEADEPFDPGNDILEWAKHAMPITDDLPSAGYALPDGTLLDYGRRQGAYDHRTLPWPWENQNAFDVGSGSGAMVAFQRAGAMRIDGGIGLIDLETEPTPEQESVIREIIETTGRPYIDLQDGERRTHIEPDAEEARRAIGMIRRFYAGENVGRMSFAARRITPEQDAEYMKAAEAGDTAKAQEMVDAAAKAARLSTDWHHSGTFGSQGETEFETEPFGVHFGTLRQAEERTGGKSIDDFISEANVAHDEGAGGWYWESLGMESLDVFGTEEEARADLDATAVEVQENNDFEDIVITDANLALGNQLRLPDLGTWGRSDLILELRKNGIKVPDGAEYHDIIKAITGAGYGSIVYRNAVEGKGSDSVIVFHPSQIKSADPFTYADSGKLIPLSQRFQPEQQDIRFAARKLEDNMVEDDKTESNKPSKLFKTPKKTIPAYKLFRTLKTKPGELFPLFIGKTTPTPVGKWIPAEFLPTKGFAARPGWHAGVAPLAPHLMKKDGTMAPGRVWAEVEIPADVDWQSKADETKRGDIRDEVPVGGHYRFQTSKMQGGAWIIGGAIKVNRVLSDEEVAKVNKGFEEPPDVQFAARIPNGKQVQAEHRDLDELGFYSNLRDVLNRMPQDKMGTGQFKAWLGKQAGVKQAELKWMGLDEFLALKGSVTKQALQEWAAQNAVQLSEVVKSDEVPEGFPKGWTVEQEDIRVPEGDGFRETERFRLRDYLGRDQGVFVTEAEAREEANEAVGLQAGTTKFNTSDLVLPGGENYREVLVTLPVTQAVTPEGVNDAAVNELRERIARETGDIPLALEEAIDEWAANPTADAGVVIENQTGIDPFEIAGTAVVARERTDTFKGGHFDEPNIIAHTRLTDREGPNGEKILFVEEVQSDWASDARKKGTDTTSIDQTTAALNSYIAELADKYGVPVPRRGSEYSDFKRKTVSDQEEAQINALVRSENEAIDKGRGVPDQPFMKNWHELTMKRILRMAVEEGYDSVSWITGSQTADRYDLSKQLSVIEYSKKLGEGVDAVDLVAFDKSGNEVMRHEGVTGSEVPNIIGKDLARKISESKDSVGALRGVDLKVGGEWATTLYDKVLPNFMKKYTKKWGGKVGDTVIITSSDYTTQDLQSAPEGVTAQSFIDSGEGVTVHNLPITEAMKEGVSEGQPLFAVRRAEPTTKEQIDKSLRVSRPPTISKRLKLAQKTQRAFDRRDKKEAVDKVKVKAKEKADAAKAKSKDQIAALKAKAHAAQVALRKKAEEDARDDRTDIAETQRVIREYIQAVLPMRERSKAIAKIDKIARLAKAETRLEYAGEAFNIIDELFAKVQQSMVHKKLAAVINKWDKRLKRAQGKGKSILLGTTQAAKLREYIDSVTTMPEKKGDKLIAIQQWLDANPDAEMPTKLMANMAEAMRPNIHQMSTEEATEALEEIKTIAKHGKLKIEIQRDRHARDLNRRAKRAAKAIRKAAKLPSTGKVDQLAEAKSMAESRGTKAKLRGWRDKLDRGAAELIRPERHIWGLEGYDPSRPLWSQTFKKGLDAENAYLRRRKQDRENWEKISEGVNLSRARIKPIYTLKYDFNGEAKEKEFTMEGLMFVYGMAQSEGGRRHLYGSGYTDAIISRLEEVLPENGKAMVDRWFEYAKGNQYDAMNKVFEEEHGVPMVPVLNYIMIENLKTDRAETAVISDALARHSTKRKAGVSKGNTVPRIKSSAPFGKLDLFGSMTRSMQNTARYVAYTHPIREIGEFLNHPAVQAAMEESSPAAKREVEQWLRDTALGRLEPAKTSVDRFAETASRNATIAILPFNIPSWLVQVASIFPGAARLKNPATAATALARMMRNPVKTQKYIYKLSPMMESRGASWEREMAESYEREGLAAYNSKYPSKEEVQRGLFFGQRALDYATTMVLWDAKFREVYDANIDKPNAKKEAAQAADELIRTTQPMGGIMHLPSLMKHPGLVRSMTRFTNQLNQFVNIAVEMRKDKTTGFGRKAIWVGGYMLSQMLVFVLRHGRLPKKWEEVAEGLLGPFVDAVPIVGQVARLMAFAFMSIFDDDAERPGMYDLDLLPFGLRPAEDMLKGALATDHKQLWSALGDGDISEAWDAVDSKLVSGAASAIGAPGYVQARRTIKGVTEFKDTGDPRYLIWSKYKLDGKTVRTKRSRQRGDLKPRGGIEDRGKLKSRGGLKPRSG